MRQLPSYGEYHGSGCHTVPRSQRFGLAVSPYVLCYLCGQSEVESGTLHGYIDRDVGKNVYTWERAGNCCARCIIELRDICLRDHCFSACRDIWADLQTYGAIRPRDPDIGYYASFFSRWETRNFPR